MTIYLNCPKCRFQIAYEKSELDTSMEITCSRCGYSELPTAFQSSQVQEKKSWQVAKIVIIVIVGIAFSLVGIFVIALAAFLVPVIIAAVIFVLLYQRWKARN
jgi:predicted nucleic-acid-binding Zn-ribbon protein